MRVWAVVCDCGLNGAWCDSVWSTEEAAVKQAEHVNKTGSGTGWSGAEVQELPLDVAP